MANPNLQEAVSAWRVLDPGMLVGGLPVIGLLRFWFQRGRAWAFAPHT